MSDLAKLQSELAARNEDLNGLNEMLEMFPDDAAVVADATSTKPGVEAEIAELKSKIAALQPKSNAAAPPPPPAAGDGAPPKYDMSKHPKFHKPASSDAPPPPTEEKQVVFNVKDEIMAKWSGDKSWYRATITSKTGSNAEPVYKVTFKEYGDTETKRKYEVRAIVEPKKRKADGPPPPPTSTAAAPPSPKRVKTDTPVNNAVISAAPAIDTTVKPVRREPSKVSDGPTRMPPEPKKLKGSKTLDKAKSSWQSFQMTGPKKTGAAAAGGGGSAMKMMSKESQFRTPDLPGAKVGFTGSGKPMQKDQPRSKWNYATRERDD